MPEAQIADDAAKARFRVEGRQLYNPPVNPRHRPLPLIMRRPEHNGERVWMRGLTEQQRADVDAMFAEGDERRAATLNVLELDRSIDLCRRTLGRVPKWMTMARALLLDIRRAKYPEKAGPEA